MTIRPQPTRRFLTQSRMMSACAIAGAAALQISGCDRQSAPDPCVTCQGAQQDATGGGNAETSSSSIGGSSSYDSRLLSSGGRSANSSHPKDASIGGTSEIVYASEGASVGGSTASSATDFTWPKRCTKVVGSVAKEMVATGALLLDVRSPNEFAVDSLPGAVNLPLAEISTRKTELDTARPVVVYCHSGSRAAQALTELCAAGFDVYDLGPEANWSL